MLACLTRCSPAPAEPRWLGRGVFDDQTWPSCQWGHWVLFTYGYVLRNPQATLTHSSHNNDVHKTKYGVKNYTKNTKQNSSLKYKHFEIDILHIYILSQSISYSIYFCLSLNKYNVYVLHTAYTIITHLTVTSVKNDCHFCRNNTFIE